MKTVKLEYLYLSILICVFVSGTFTNTLVHAAKTISGVERFQVGIESHENGKYDDAIFNLEMAKIQLSEYDKESLWNVHFYLGLSYYLTGDNEESKKEFVKAKEIFNGKLPDPYTHSPKIVKLFKEAINQK